MIITRKELVDKLKTNWDMTERSPGGEYWQPKIADFEVGLDQYCSWW